MNVNELIELIKNDSFKKESIGTKKEKSIHQFIKYYISSDVRTHEVSLSSKIIDVYVNNTIYEIQTRSFYKLRDKLSVLLPNYKVTICFPIYCDKSIELISDDKSISIRKSPKKEFACKILSELYSLIPFLDNANLSFKLFMFSILEKQTFRINKYKKTVRTPIDKYPLKLYEIINISSYKDIINILPKEILTLPFCADDFKKYTHLSSRNASYALQVLKKVNLIKIVKKDGKKYIYELNN